MDRTMYGRVAPGPVYQPYRCALKSSSPAYALLADLQNTISPGGGGGYGSLSRKTQQQQQQQQSSHHHSSSHHHHQHHQQHHHQQSGAPPPSRAPDYATVSRPHRTPSLSPTYQNESGSKMTSSLNNNLSELDTLLQDLSNSRYSHERKADLNGSTVEMSPSRPPTSQVASQLPSPVPNGKTFDREVVEKVDSELGDHYVQKIMIEETTTTTTTAAAGAGAGKTARPTASSATRELDDLMASLSDFKVSGRGAVVESNYAKPAKQRHQTKEQLDCMLGSLQADMSRQGVNTTAKGCCGACDKPIVGQVITALGQTWHPEHFVCAHCNQELGTRNFFERDGRPYCEADYHNLFSPRCAYCNGPILDKCVTALDKTWHTEHFFCAQCGKQFGEEGFHEREGRPYCRDDYFELFAPKCGGCSRPIMENYVSALSSQWHTDCFVCRDCKKPVQGKTFYAMEGKPVCPKCVGAEEEED